MSTRADVPVLSPRCAERMTTSARTIPYLSMTCLTIVLAFFLGVARFDSICDESDPEVTECDLGAIWGFGWAAAALCLCAIGIIVSEGCLRSRRRRDAAR